MIKEILTFLKELLPLWLFFITIGFFCLVYLYTKLIKEFNRLSDKQTQYLKDQIDSVDKATGIFERTVKHQEDDLQRMYELNEKLKSELQKDKEEKLHLFDEQLIEISKVVKEFQKDKVSKNELDGLREEIMASKKLASNQYDNIIKQLDTQITQIYPKVKSFKNIFVSLPHNEKSENHFQIIKEISEESKIQITRGDRTVQDGVAIKEKIKHIIEISDLVISDLTHHNLSAVYELGYASALNKPIIILVSENSKLEISIADFMVIYFNENEAGLECLRNSLRTTFKTLITDDVKQLIRANEIIQLQPNVFGIGIDLNKLIKKVFDKSK